MDHGEGQTGPAEDQMPQRQGEGQRHNGRQTVPSEDEIPQQEGEVQRHGGDPAGSTDHGRDQAGSAGHSEDQAGATDPDETMERRQRRSFTQRITVATGYVATGLLALTLIIGPANLLLRKRNPVSSYLRRDVGTWTAIFSAVHVIFGLQSHSGGQISGFLNYFVVDDSPLLNRFGLGNWTGLAATVIVVGLLAISSNFALGKLKARTWKWLQRLNYALFALVIAHAIFYGALLRVTSPYTLLLGLIVIAVFAGQAMGIWAWRRRRISGRQAFGRHP